jgi:hypothetical protein
MGQVYLTGYLDFDDAWRSLRDLRQIGQFIQGVHNRQRPHPALGCTLGARALLQSEGEGAGGTAAGVGA